MNLKTMIGDCFDTLRRRIFLILWITLVLYIFYNTFVYYISGRQFYYLREILGAGLCISRASATILNLCCALVLLPLCKKLNQILYKILSKLWPGLFFFWLERAKSFHMTIAITLLVFSVLHSISHFVNLWNFSRGYDEQRIEINFASYKNESPFSMLMSVAGMTGVSMLIITGSMGLTSVRVLRRTKYNAFWYTHQMYLPFMVMLVVHPLGGALKEEIIDLELNESSSHPSHWTKNSTIITPKFIAIPSKTWQWMAIPLSLFFLDLLWRIFTRNCAKVDIIRVKIMAGRTISLTVSCPHEQFPCRVGQYVLLQCINISLIEWHPFTVVQIPTTCQRSFVVWIRVKGDWTEALEKLVLVKQPKDISVLVDGPFSSPMQGAGRSRVAVCVAAGVGITPFVPILQHLLENPRSRVPGRIHLLWIVRHENEISWLADLANKTLLQLRRANRPDRLHLELYVTYNEDAVKYPNNKEMNSLAHVVMINEGGALKHVLENEKRTYDDEKVTLLTPHKKRSGYINDRTIISNDGATYCVAKEHPLLGCRVRRGRPHWDRVFGYWVHLYPKENLSLYCCGPKKLVKLLRNKCRHITRTTKTNFTFIHEGFA